MKNALLLCLISLGMLSALNGCLFPPPGNQIIYSLEPPPPAPPVQPAIVSPSPQVVVVDTVPDVYYVQTAPNLFFHSNAWYYYYGGWWYQSPSCNGPWVYLEFSLVPEHLYRVPPSHFRPYGPPERRSPPRGHDQGGHEHGDRNRGGYDQNRDRDNGPAHRNGR